MFKNSLWSTVSTGGPAYLSMESVDANGDFPANPETGEIPSDGDFEQAIEEAADISNSVDEIQRTTQAADVGEMIAQTADSANARGNVTPEEAALVQAGAAQTLTAVGARGGEAVEVAEGAATESNGRYQLSTEGFKETLKKVWAGIKRFVDKVINSIKDTFNRLWNSTAGVIKRCKKLKDELKEKKDELKDKDDKLEKWYGWMNKLAATETVSFNMENVPKFASDMGGEVEDMIKDTQKAIKDIKDYMNKADSKEAADQKVVSDFFKTIKSTIIGSSKRTKAVAPYLGKDYVGVVASSDYGNYGIAVGYDNSANLTNSAKIGSFTCRQVSVKEHFDAKVKDPKFNIMKHSETSKLADDIEAACKKMEKWYNTGIKDAYKDLDSAKKDLDKALEKIDEEGTGEERDRYRTYQRMYPATTQILRINMSTMVYYIKQMNAVLSCGFAMVPFYKDKNDKD